MSVTGIERIFSINLRKILCNVINKADRINEIRLRAGQPLMVIIDNMERFVNPDGEITLTYENAYIVTVNEIRETMEYISNYSIYAYEEEIKQGYITVAGGHRIGICGKAIIENNRVKTLRYISFINIRIAHEMIGCSDRLIPKSIKIEIVSIIH